MDTYCVITGKKITRRGLSWASASRLANKLNNRNYSTYQATGSWGRCKPSWIQKETQA